MKVSIVVLIYKSVDYLKFIIDQVKRFTPEEHELNIVMNDPTEEIVEFTQKYDETYAKLFKNVIFHRFRNENPDEYYLNRVYRAWNEGVKQASGDIVVLLNSDMGLSKDWLKNLLKVLTEDIAVSSRLVESGRMPSGKHGVSIDLGKTIKDYDELKFQTIAENIKQEEMKEGGLYSPIAFYKKTFLELGGYPHGNLMINGVQVPGDVLFWSIAKTKGINHYTVFDSIVYHFQEGEMRS